jgi:hypothetical protein
MGLREGKLSKYRREFMPWKSPIMLGYAVLQVDKGRVGFAGLLHSQALGTQHKTTHYGPPARPSYDLVADHMAEAQLLAMKVGVHISCHDISPFLCRRGIPLVKHQSVG